MATWPMLAGFHSAFHYSTVRYLHGSVDKIQVAAPSGIEFEMMLAEDVAVVGVAEAGDVAAGDVAVDGVAVAFAVH